MQSHIDELSKPVELVADLVSGLFATVKGCSELLWHHRFVDCEFDTDLLTEIIEAPVERYATQVLNMKADIFDTDDVVDACKMVARALKWLQGRKRMK